MANYKSAISFGLVHIPVILNPIIKNNDTSFNFLHKKCKNRIKYQKVCPHCNEEVAQQDLVKGYEYSKDKYITMEDEDFEKIKTENDRTIQIIAFVNLSEIDPIYYERSYYLMTDASNKAFSLFKKALSKVGKVAIAKTVLGNKSYYVILRFGQSNVIMSTLFYEEEIRLGEEIIEENFTEEELALAIKLIENMSDKFKPETYHDDYQNKVKEAINQKINGQEVKEVKSKKTRNINDLMEALEKSLSQKKKRAA